MTLVEGRSHTSKEYHADRYGHIYEQGYLKNVLAYCENMVECFIGCYMVLCYYAFDFP